MSVAATYGVQVTVQETLESNVDAAAAASRVVTHNLFNSAKTMNAESTPPATKVAAFTKALAAGVGTIDLTALAGTNGAAVDGTGLKVQALKVKNKGTNPLTIAVGASNGYELAGSGFTVTLATNQEFTFFGNDATPDIAAGAKTLDLTGVGAQTSEWIAVLG